MSGTGMLEVWVAHPVHSGLSLDISFRLGTTCGIVFGRSGSGKTTLLRLISGLVRPVRGRIVLDDTTLFDSDRGINLPLRSRHIGMIFQDDLLFPHLNVTENVAFGLRDWSRADAGDRVNELAELCGITALLERWPSSLSGGERQRVGLARALAPRPRLLLCDEPVSALDVNARHALLERLKRLQSAVRLPVLYVTHSPSEAVFLGTTLFLIQGGQIAVNGSPLEVLAESGNGPDALEGLTNVFEAVITDQAPDRGETRVRVDDGPDVIIPFQNLLPGHRLSVAIRADDILLAREPVTALSARNRIPGIVERWVLHGPQAEVLIRSGSLTWVVSVVTSALSALALHPGVEVRMIIKARSCHVVDMAPLHIL